ncbi:MAG: outer membrane beta-barrel protein [Gemmatimonadota bacterium]|nr:MAG: outer membrane beta-barrel protein [Gemmatimonadota bacterium]
MFKRLMLGSALALFFASPSFAQNPIEIGVDNAIVVDLVQEFKVDDVVLGESRTDIGFSLPFSFWRFGFFVNENISIEPGIGFQLISIGDDGGTSYDFNGTVDILYNMPSNLYFHVGGAIFATKIDLGGELESETLSQFGFGGGLGYRIPLIGDNVMARVGARGLYVLKSEDDGLPASINVIGSFGLSVMTQ